MPTATTTPGFTRASYPGELGVPPLGLSIDLPESWTIDPVPGAVAIAREPQAGPQGFWANLVLSIDRVGPAVSLDQIATSILRDSQDGVEDFRIADEHVLEVGGVPAVLREQTVRVAATPLPLVQFVLVLLAESGGGRARDCVQLTGSVELARRDELAAIFEHCCGSIVLDG